MATEQPIACVGVGASAGGLKALRSLLETFSSDDGLCFVVVQHLERNHDSRLFEILNRSIDLVVAEAQDAQELNPNTVYVIPPNRYISVHDGKIQLTEYPEDRLSRMPIDHLFASLAEKYRGRAIGVVLTGTGSDGTGGVQLIREFGGLTIAQNPEEAEYDGMPRSAIHSGTADQVLPIKEMRESILFFLHNRESTTEVAAYSEQSELGRVLTRIQQRGVHDFSEYKTSTIGRRVQRRMGLVRAESLEQYIEMLERDDREVERLTRDLLISVTRFFRDPEAFASLQETMTALLEERSQQQIESVRAWVPGCATGEEAYSVAITLFEAVCSLDLNVRIQVFGTDVDRRALQAARTGRYGGYIRGHVPEEYLERYFSASDEGYRVTPALREAVLFSPQDMLSDPAFSGLDLVSCRNLLIYLNRDVHDRFISLFHFSLRETGVLFLGNAETIGENERLFRAVDRPRRIYRRRPEADSQLGRAGKAPVTAEGEGSSKTVVSKREQSYPQRATERALAEWFGPAAVTIDADDQVQFLHGEVNHYLQFPKGEPRYQVNKLLRPGLSARVLAAVRSIRAGGDPLDEIVHYPEQDAWRSVRLVVRPVDANSGLIVIAFEPHEELTIPEGDGAPSDSEHEIVRSLERELESSDLAILIFDNELRLGRHSRRAGQLFGLLGTDSGRHIGGLSSRLQEMISLDVLMQALDGEYTQQELQDGGSEWYLLRCLPYRRSDDSVAGVVVTITDVTELHDAKDQVASLLDRYQSLTENSTDIIVRFDRNYRHIYVNRHISDVVDFTPEEYIGKTNRELGFDPEVCAFWEESIDAAFRTGELQRVEFALPDKEGHERVFDWKVVREESGQSVLAVARDITDLADARRNLERALADREVLIRDVHHRVKNNLFLLVGLLIMEREQLRKTVRDSEPVVRSLNKIMGRVQVISSIYEYLYRSSGEAEYVDAEEFVDGLAELVQAAYEEREVELDVSTEQIQLPVDTAIPVGLMLNEILTNAYKHAFEPSDSGRIEISMTQTADGNEAALTVQDDGKGFSEDEVQQKESVGTTLVSTLANQIEGKVERENHNGTRVTVRFPLREEREEGEANDQ